MQVGMIFNPGWTDVIVVISEVLNRLPVWAQYPYAEYVLDQLKPTKWVPDISVTMVFTLIPRPQAPAPRLVRCVELRSPRVHPSA